MFDGLPLTCIGTVVKQPRLEITIDKRVFGWDVVDLSRVFKETLADD